MGFYLTFSRTGKSWKKTTGPGNILNSSNKFSEFTLWEMYEDCKEN